MTRATWNHQLLVKRQQGTFTIVLRLTNLVFGANLKHLLERAVEICLTVRGVSKS